MARVNGEALKVIRNRSGMSLRALSEESGVAFSYIRGIEAGAHQPSWTVLEKLARALRILPTTVLVDPKEERNDDSAA